MNTSDYLTFIGFFFAGLAVNLTPCVYPMLSVTISLFKPEFDKKESLRHSFFRALAYFLGITVMYTALGIFAASSGKLFGSFLQNQWVLAAVGLLMLVLSLSMFGLFQIRPPVELLDKLSTLRRVDYVGLFLSGMFVGVFAAPCIGPPVLALLAAVADKGDPKFGFAAFFTFSCGMGLPYLFLGTFSKLTTKLPKAGVWLIWVERIFAVVLLAFAIFYFALAFKVHPKNEAVETTWKSYSAQALNSSLMLRHPVIIDFYADWCLSCHELEKTVFSKPEVIALLKQLTALRLDATDVDSAAVSAIIEKYAIIGLPTVVFLDEQGQEIKDMRVEGVVSKEKFIKRLQQQLENKKKWNK